METEILISNEKKRIRKMMLAKRDAMSSEEVKEKSLQIFDRLTNMPEWKEATCIYAFNSLGNEPITKLFFEEALKTGKIFASPRVKKNRQMNFISIQSESDLEEGSFGLLEPIDKGLYVTGPGLVLVPGLAFGQDFYRIGFGAGYYDTYFENHKKGDGICMAAIAYDFQILEEIVHDNYDIKMDIIVTDKRCIKKS